MGRTDEIGRTAGGWVRAAARLMTVTGGLLLAPASARYAAAMTIEPYFDSSITGASNAADVEFAINTAINTIDSLYSNPGAIQIVFSQAAGSFVGQSQTADYGTDYTTYTNLLSYVSSLEPTNSVLSTALANLSVGNQPGSVGDVLFTTADAELVLGLGASNGVTACFNSAGAFVNTCNQDYVGVVTLSTSVPLNYTTSPVAGEYSAIAGAEHEIDEILGGGGQGSILNAIADGMTQYANDVGVLDLYRYSAPGVPSFTTSGSATAYFSVDGGDTDIVGFNQNNSGDYGDFGPSGYVQSAFGSTGTLPSYTLSSPEVTMMESIGYDATVPEPASLSVFASAVFGLLAKRCRRSARHSPCDTRA